MVDFEINLKSFLIYILKKILQKIIFLKLQDQIRIFPNIFNSLFILDNIEIFQNIFFYINYY